MLQRINTYQIRSTSDQYDTFEQQLTGMSIPFFKVYTATQGQTLFELPEGVYYQLGTGQLSVYYNGQYQDAGATQSYTEVNEKQIRFNFPLYAEDQVILRMEGAGGGATTVSGAKISNLIPEGSINGINRVFSIPHIPREGSLKVYINGVCQSPNTYTLKNNTFTLDESPRSYFSVTVDYEV